MIMEGITDNKNRTLGEIKGILSQFDGKMAGEGSVRWMFERKGVITIANPQTPKEELELLAIEAGADDVAWRGTSLEIYTKPEELEGAKKALEQKGVKFDQSYLSWVAKEEVALGEKELEKAQKLFEALDENDAIQDAYSNLKY